MAKYDTKVMVKRSTITKLQSRLAEAEEKLVRCAAGFAAYKHRNQRRKYTNELYFVHCKEVADLVASVSNDKNVVMAAYLHDTLEDTDATYDEIASIFGFAVADLVLEVTDVSKPSDGNREVRKALDRNHIAKASKNGQLIKLADLISNTTSIVERDPQFAVKYMAEKELLLKVIDPSLPLYDQALAKIQAYKKGE